MYIFPGLALGAHLGKTGTITDSMIQTSAEALPELITPEDLRLGYVFPRLSDARCVRPKLHGVAAQYSSLLSPLQL